MPKPIFCLMGPTAAGKTALAIELVKTYPFEIISVDSAMIYRDMDIGTAKPSAEELNIAPHHLIDIINPDAAYSAAQFCADALNLCDSIIKRHKIPLLVGGTMMYFNALQQGLSILPEADEAIRKQIEDDAQKMGWQWVHQQLTRIDPKSAARIHEHDTQRIQRALEVYYASGKTLTELQAQQTQGPNYQFVNFILFPQQRAWLHERIALRFTQMLEQGFIAEVKQLQAKWPISPNMPSMRCVGYRQILEYLNGEIDYQLLTEKGVAATRQLAKRQLTWLRHWPESINFDPQDPTFAAQIIAKAGEIIDNNPF